VIYIFPFYYSFIHMSGCVGMGPSALLFLNYYIILNTCFIDVLQKLPSSQINLYCLSAEISNASTFFFRSS
jgi:hypothetical protein